MDSGGSCVGVGVCMRSPGGGAKVGCSGLPGGGVIGAGCSRMGLGVWGFEVEWVFGGDDVLEVACVIWGSIFFLEEKWGEEKEMANETLDLNEPPHENQGPGRLELEALGFSVHNLTQDDEDGNSWVLNSKQGFQDCEMYAKLEEWLGRKADEYWDKNFDTLELRKGGERYKADHEWVQCYSCRKWRILNAGFDTKSLPDEWFCYMLPFNGKCEVPEQQMGRGVIVIGEKRSGHDGCNRITQQEEVAKVDANKVRSDDSESQRFTQDEDVKGPCNEA
ncbi:hypothetical protein E2562_004583 [Oryza meyeriana var. granulata]|uniref:CW-type domain-containing protein n=1 Tax=Oryza meyeriana var. granulata TaxID=110450 RepID=A0A6G1F3P3_9ORYZ|nr:hypothetical protein E2562_004583 [Oryza meyeriana var. granulata]